MSNRWSRLLQAPILSRLVEAVLALLALVAARAATPLSAALLQKVAGAGVAIRLPTSTPVAAAATVEVPRITVLRALPLQVVTLVVCASIGRGNMAQVAAAEPVELAPMVAAAAQEPAALDEVPIFREPLRRMLLAAMVGRLTVAVAVLAPSAVAAALKVMPLVALALS